MTKKSELKKHYNDAEFKTFFTEDCENITRIDFDNEVVYSFVSVSASCGCCSEIEDRETELDAFIAHLSNGDYESLLSELKGE